MQDPNTERAALLPVETMRAEGAPSGTHEVAAKQIGQWALIWRRFRQHRLAVAGLWILALVALLVIVGPHFALPIVATTDFVITGNHGQAPRLWPLSLKWIMGTADNTAPVSSYFLVGGRPMLIVGFGGAVIASIVGTIIGSISGYFGRFVDTILMRITDAFLTVPFLPFLYLLQFYLPDRSIPTFAILFGIIGWGGVARLVRSYILSLQQREFAEAARALGVSDVGIIVRHLLPNTLDIIFISFTLNVAVFIITEASLVFLGGGPFDPSWASVMEINPLYFNWWQTLFPFIPLLLTVLAVNLIGDGLRDAFDTTGSGTKIRWRERPPRSVTRLLSAGATQIIQPVGRGIRTGRGALGTVRQRIRPATARPVPAPLPYPAKPNAASRVVLRLERLPLAVRLLPVLAVLVAGGIVFLFGHSPLRYAPHFAVPTHLITVQEQGEYGAHAIPGGGWDLFDTAGHNGTLTYARISGNGTVTRRQVVAPQATTGVSMAGKHGWLLGVWVSPDNSRLMAAYVGKHRSRPFSLVPATGTVEHPFAVSVPGGFDVLFDWNPSIKSNAFQIYLAEIRLGQTSPARIRLIGRTSDYALEARAATDRSGTLDVLYLDRVKLELWAMRFRRFRADGTPAGKRQTIGYACWPCIGPPTDVVPQRWGTDLREGPDGSVWVVWDGTLNGPGPLNIARWDAHGRQILPPTEFPVGADGEPNVGYALVPEQHGGQLYYTGANGDGGVGSVTYMQKFDDHGYPVGLAQRVNYDAEGSSALPRAALVHGQPQVVWLRVRAGPAFLEASRYLAHARPPDLLTRMGLNVGALWSNLLILIVGALAGGVGIAIANAFLLLLLILLWLPIGWIIPRRIRPGLHLLVIAAVLIEVFGRHLSQPSWIILISGLGSPQNWVAVAAAIFCAAWASFVLFRRYEPIFRATATAFTAVYVIAVMYAVIFIQGEITRI